MSQAIALDPFQTISFDQLDFVTGGEITARGATTAIATGAGGAAGAALGSALGPVGTVVGGGIGAGLGYVGGELLSDLFGW